MMTEKAYAFNNSNYLSEWLQNRLAYIIAGQNTCAP